MSTKRPKPKRDPELDRLLARYLQTRTDNVAVGYDSAEFVAPRDPTIDELLRDFVLDEQVNQQVEAALAEKLARHLESRPDGESPSDAPHGEFEDTWATTARHIHLIDDFEDRLQTYARSLAKKK